MGRSLVLSGVGDKKSICEHGRYQITIPLHDGENINLSGICLDKITSEFPLYPLNEVESDIREIYASAGGSVRDLPKLPKCVGGNTDIMIGIQYNIYYPTEVFRLPNGLSIYESQLANPDGSRGIVGGPHKVFTKIHKDLGADHMSKSAYISEIVHAYCIGFKLSLDFSLLDIKEQASHFSNDEIKFDEMEKFPMKENKSVDELKNEYKCKSSNVFLAKKNPSKLKVFEEIEAAGTEVSYRCVRCRGCQDCKNSGNIECISIQEEVETENH